MLRLACAFALTLAFPAAAETPPGEKPVAAYAVSDANAGAAPLEPALYEVFGGAEGVRRIVAGMLDRSVADPRTAEIFKAIDRVRLERTLNEQVCYVLGGGCAYTGRDMKTVHKDMGLTTADMGALVEHLQHAMDAERVPFRAQNRLLAKLAPMKRDVVER